MVSIMSTARTGAERYFQKQRTDPAYEREFQAARRRIARVVAAVNKLLDRTQRPDGQSG